MAKVEVLTFPNSILRRTCEEVRQIDDEIIRIAHNMADTMYEDKGIGLAAPQIGITKRIIVLDIGEGLVTLVNPEITLFEGDEVMEEGCLCLPKITVDVPRYTRVQVKGIDLTENPVSFEADDLLARVFQHEIDHLKGTLIIDKLSKVKRDMLVRKMRKLYLKDQK